MKSNGTLKGESLGFLSGLENIWTKLLTFNLRSRPSNNRTTQIPAAHASKNHVNMEVQYSFIISQRQALHKCILKSRTDFAVERCWLPPLSVLLCCCMFRAAENLWRARWGIGVQSLARLVGWPVVYQKTRSLLSEEFTAGKHSHLAYQISWFKKTCQGCVFARLSHWLKN